MHPAQPRSRSSPAVLRRRRLDPTAIATAVDAVQGPRNLFTYMAFFRVAEARNFSDWLICGSSLSDPLLSTRSVQPSGRAVGLAALIRIPSGYGVVEVGNIMLSPRLQRTRFAPRRSIAGPLCLQRPRTSRR